jgi:hypothetical protein
VGKLESLRTEHNGKGTRVTRGHNQLRDGPVELVQAGRNWYVPWCYSGPVSHLVLDEAEFLVTKWKEAERMSKEMKESWLEFQKSLDPAQVSSWEMLNTDPAFANGRWSSVYIMSESPGRLAWFNAYDLS